MSAKLARFFEGCRQGDVDKIASLLRSDASLISCEDENGSLGLHVAAYNDRVAALDYLLSHGANDPAVLNKQDGMGRTAVYWAAEVCTKGILNQLIAAKANVNLGDHTFMTPLMTASYNGKADCARALLLAQADINATNSSGRTALQLAQDRVAKANKYNRISVAKPTVKLFKVLEETQVSGLFGLLNHCLCESGRLPEAALSRCIAEYVFLDVQGLHQAALPSLLKPSAKQTSENSDRKSSNIG